MVLSLFLQHNKLPLSLSEGDSVSKVASDLTLKKLLKVLPYILASREERI
jgi:hypothetical protein